MDKIVLGIGGSSGSIYAKRILDRLANRSNLELAVVYSSNALTNWNIEIDGIKLTDYEYPIYYDKNDFFAPFASGSSTFRAMIICPCSMGLIGRITSGLSNDLMTRAADVMLKERRKLVIVPREAPYNLIHLENMTKLTQAGAIICPATPSFYHKPTSLEEIADTVVDRILDLADLSDPSTKRWQE